MVEKRIVHEGEVTVKDERDSKRICCALGRLGKKNTDS